MSEGFLGGTFDPPHLGHAVLAQEAMEGFDLERVFFVPSRNPPHKGRDRVSPFPDRVEMLSIALSEDPRFGLLDAEPREGPSYTVKLVERLAGIRKEKPFLILGMDSLTEMHLWHLPERVLTIARVVVGTRPGFSAGSVDDRLLGGVTLFSYPGVCISSSDVRRKVRKGRSIRYLVTEGVRSYIREKGLYGPGKGG